MHLVLNLYRTTPSNDKFQRPAPGSAAATASSKHAGFLSNAAHRAEAVRAGQAEPARPLSAPRPARGRGAGRSTALERYVQLDSHAAALPAAVLHGLVRLHHFGRGSEDYCLARRKMFVLKPLYFP